MKNVPLFAGLSRYQLEQVGAVCSIRNLNKDQILFRQGDAAHHVFVVLTGKLSVEALAGAGAEVVLATRAKGEVIGEMAVLEDSPRSATVTAIKDSRLLVLHRSDFEHLVKRNPEIGLEMLRHMSRRVRQLSQLVTDSRSESLKSRVLHFLQSLADAEGVTILEQPQRAIAQELGCTREALSRNIHQLIAEKQIEKLSSSCYRLSKRRKP